MFKQKIKKEWEEFCTVILLAMNISKQKNRLTIIATIVISLAAFGPKCFVKISIVKKANHETIIPQSETSHSTGIAMLLLASKFIDFSNYGIGKIFKKNPDSIGVFVLRTYISTAVGQFVDNLVFAFIVSYFFFGWSIGQCFICAATNTSF